MRLTWRQQLDMRPELSQFANWPIIIPSEVPIHKRAIFNRNRRIISKILLGYSLTEVSKFSGVSKSRVNQILQRCLSCDPDDCPALTVALIPGQRIKHGIRTSCLSDLGNQAGARGAFSYLLLNVSGLKQNLDNMIKTSLKRSRFSQNLTAKSFHKEFLRLLVDANWSLDKYPFDQKTLASESCRKYLKERQMELSTSQPKHKRVISLSGLPHKPYQEVQIDAQTQDVNVSILIEQHGQTQLLRISRVTLFLATDVATDCRLAYHLCLTKDPTELDLLSLLEKIHLPWEPMSLQTPGLSYEPGACFPSALGELYQNAGIGMLRLDNALCHMSHAVRNFVCHDLNSTLNFGLPAHPKGRNFVEHAFKLLNEYTHRFASTTGSYPTDIIKETKSNASSPPELTLRAFKECLSVLTTNHNITPQERLGGISPLQILEQKMNSQLCQITFSRLHQNPTPFAKRKLVSVKHVKKRPHVNFMGLRYVGDCLSNSDLIGSKVTAEYDQRDIRSLRIFTTDGKYVGEAKAPRTWQARPISLRTKKRLSSETRTARLKMKDPLGEYFSMLVEKKHKPKNALELVRIYEESFTYENTSVISDKNFSEAVLNEKKNHSKIPSWSPRMITNGELV